MSPDDIADLARKFAEAAVCRKEAVADGVQIHAAHGYLLSQFLSPISNKRTDEYGGTIEKRGKIVFDTYASIRSAVGRDYLVWIKINTSDVEAGGMSSEESRWVCAQLAGRGIDAIEASDGISVSPQSTSARKVSDERGESYLYPEALTLAETTGVDVISVGGHRSPERLEEKLEQEKVKAVSLCRPFICEPDLANEWRSGNLKKAKCISCNRCFSPGALGCKTFPQ